MQNYNSTWLYTVTFFLLFYFFQAISHATFVIFYTFSKLVFSNSLFAIFCSLLSTNLFTHTHTHAHTHKMTLTSGYYGQTDHRPSDITRFLKTTGLQPDSFYIFDGSLFHQSVPSSVINTTELPVDIHPSPPSPMSHTSFNPSHITLFFQPPERFNLCYQWKFLLSKSLFLRRAHNSIVSFLWWTPGLYH